MRSAFAGILLFGLVPVALARAQEERPAGVVLDFEGRGGSAARRLVVDAISDEVRLVPNRDARRAARRLDADMDTPEGMASMARDLGIRVIVRGAVRGRGRRAETEVVVVDADGREVMRSVYGSPTDRAAREEIGSAVLAGVRTALADRQAVPEGVAVEQAVVDEERPPMAHAPQAAPPAAASTIPVLVLSLGPVFRTRNAEIRVTRTAPGTMTQDTRRYDVSGFVELSLVLELHPFASSGSLRGLFARVEGARSIFLDSRDRDDSVLETSTLRFTGELGYVHQFGKLGVGLVAGFSLDSFEIEPNMTLPASSYSALRTGIVAQLPLEERLFIAELEAGWRFVLGIGDLASAFGADASAQGFDVGAGFRGALEMDLVYSLRVAYQRVALDFAGAAEDEVGIDGHDQAFVITGRAGWQF
jgi:hypothetical protein